MSSLDDEIPDELPLGDLVGALCEITGAGRDELKRSRRGRSGNPVRRFAVWALTRTTDLPQREIGAVLGMTASNVSRAMKRPRPQAELFDRWVAQWSARFPDMVSVSKRVEHDGR